MEDCEITVSSRKFSIPCFDNTLMGSPTKPFASVRQQIFYRKSLYFLLRHKFFRYPKLSETQNFSSTNWFGTVRQNSLTENRDTRALSYRQTFFDTRIFFKHRRGPLPNFYALWDKNFWQKNVIIPPPLPRSSINFFKFQYFCGTQKGSHTKFFGTLRQQFFYKKSWYSLLRNNFFRYPKLSETQKDSSTRSFGTVRQNNLTENRDARHLSCRYFFSIPDFLSNTEGVLYEFSTHCDTKILDRKTW